MHKYVIFLIFVASLFARVSYTKSAYCVLNEDKGSGVTGNVVFSQADENQPTLVVAKIKGLPPGGFHGFHIHEKADFSQGCISAGSHYNPYAKEHGSPNDENRHVGDMGNIQANEVGVGEITYNDTVISLFGDYSIIGRSCVLHESEDDLGLGGFDDSKTTGHAGSRIACGKIIEGEFVEEEEESSSSGGFFPKLLILLGLAGIFYYFAIYRQKDRYQTFA